MLLCIAPRLISQDTKVYTIAFENNTYEEAIESLRSMSGASIVYSDDFFDDNEIITKSFQDETLIRILERLFEGKQLDVSLKGSIYVISKIRIFTYSLSGYILDSESRERLPFATIYNNTTDEVFSSNEEGYYSVPLTTGDFTFKIFYLGHTTHILDVVIDGHQRLDILIEGDNLLPEVIIDEEKSTPIYNDRNRFSHDKLMRLAARTPGLGGSDDILQTARVIPGIQSGAGGVGGYFVRGGSNDQNLFLLDGVALYNPFHSLGLSSIFTPQTTKSLQIYKSGFRAQYGDRSSSVVDVRLKDGNLNKIEAALGYNPQDGFLKVEGPIAKGKSSFFLYGRKSTLAYKFNDVIRSSIFPDNFLESHTDYFDVIGKVQVPLGEKNKIYATYYQGSDKLEGEDEEEMESIQMEEDLHEESKLSWGNQIINVRWLSLLSHDLFLNASASRNKYFSTYGALSLIEGVNRDLQDLFFRSVNSTNQDNEYKVSLDYSALSNLRFKIGLGYLKKSYLPNITQFDEDSEEIGESTDLQFSSLDSLNQGEELHSDKWYHYIEGTWSLGRWTMQGGLRSTYFSALGADYFDVQPRLNVDYNLGLSSVLSISASRTSQYVHLLSSSEVNLPRDLWYPSSSLLPPEYTWHYNLGIRKATERIEWSAEVYYKNTDQKTMTSQTPTEQSIAVQDLYSNIGSATGYGLELSVDFRRGKWEGTFAYALSKSERQFDGINLGRPYNYQFDRRHELKGVGSYQLADGLVIGLGLYLGTGHPLLVTSGLDPNSGINPIDINSSGAKNTQRTGLQHRADFSLLYTKKLWRLTHHLKFNLYNSYDQNAPLFYTQDLTSSVLVPRFSLPVVPSLAYTVSF